MTKSMASARSPTISVSSYHERAYLAASITKEKVGCSWRSRCSHQDTVGRLPEEKSAPSVEHRQAELHDTSLVIERSGIPCFLEDHRARALPPFFAAAHPVKAVICLGYLFRNLGNPVESARYQHLAEIDIPALTPQARADEYDGSSLTLTYQLSKRILVRL
jgi:hypothetical protein